MNRVVITGARGQLARAVQAAAPAATKCTMLSHADLDICDQAAVLGAVERLQPSCLINGAAYNLVDHAESSGMEDALRINALGVGCLARVCREAAIPLVHFSTDYVFDGSQRTPYSESDAARPLGIYAASKLAGENIALAGSARNFAIRVCRLFGPVDDSAPGSQQKPGGNFPLLMLRLGRERKSVRVVCDQIGSPSYTPDLARAIWQLLATGSGGLYHLSNAGEVAFDAYARTVFELAGVECVVEPITSAQYGSPARRPLYSTLSNRKAHAAGVTPLRHWQDALAEFMAGVGERRGNRKAIF